MIEQQFSPQEVTMFLENQQRMAEDIAEIKAAVREAAQVVVFMQRDQNELKNRVEKCEQNYQNCPARVQHNALMFSTRGIMWLLTLIATVLGLAVYFKK